MLSEVIKCVLVPPMVFIGAAMLVPNPTSSPIVWALSGGALAWAVAYWQAYFHGAIQAYDRAAGRTPTRYYATVFARAWRETLEDLGLRPKQ